MQCPAFSIVEKGEIVLKNIQPVLLCAVAVLMTMYCSNKNSSGLEVENEPAVAVDLSGHVYGASGKGVSGVVVTEASLGLKDTTDNNGAYSLSMSQDTLTKRGILLDTVKGSVAFVSGGATVDTLPVTKWVDTLPDVYLIQRNIYGTMLAHAVPGISIDSIEVTLSIEGDSITPPKVQSLWIDTATNEYSGFIYFKQTSGVSYTIFAKTFSGGKPVGQSNAVTFPDKAGDIHIADFDPTNGIPTIVANDTTAFINTKLALSPAVYDSIGGAVVSYKWSIGDSLHYKAVSKSDTTIAMPGDTGLIKTFLRVADSDGNVRIARINVTVTDPLTLTVQKDTTVDINSTVTLTAKATNVYGKVKCWRWNFTPDTVWDTVVNKADTVVSMKHIFTHAAVYPVVVEVEDTSGIIRRDTINVTVANVAPTVAAVCKDNGKDTVIISIKDSVTFIGSAKDPDSSSEKYSWDLNGDGKFDDSGATLTSIGYRYPTAGVYNVVLKVTDDDGASGLDTVVVTVLQDVPVLNAGADTSVDINKVVTLGGTATQKFGTIVMWKWDFDGDGKYDDSSATSPTMSHTYTHATAYNAKLYARDDDGNVDTAIRVVTVTNIPPTVTAVCKDNGKDTVLISPNDSVTFVGSAKDPDSTSETYFWDINGDGIYEDSGATLTTIGYRYSVDGVYNVVLKVRDDDGASGFDTVVVISGTLNLIAIPGGTFLMGADSSCQSVGGINLQGDTVHLVTLTGFNIGETDVTQELYKDVMGVNPSYFNAGVDANLRPVEAVSWYNAVRFCNRISDLLGKDSCYNISNSDSTLWTCDMTKNGYRLPTEAEWEYVAKAGNDSGNYYWGNGSDTATMNANSWNYNNSGYTTHPVATKPANAFGLYDMSGNVWQWCNDWCGAYNNGVQIYRPVFRGGSWFGDNVQFYRSAFRGCDFAWELDNYVGFRMVSRP